MHSIQGCKCDLAIMVLAGSATYDGCNNSDQVMITPHELISAQNGGMAINVSPLTATLISPANCPRCQLLPQIHCHLEACPSP